MGQIFLIAMQIKVSIKFYLKKIGPRKIMYGFWIKDCFSQQINFQLDLLW